MREPESARQSEKLTIFAKRLLAEWRRLAPGPATGERVVLAVSGGADSCALLLAVDELIKSGRLALQITVAHLDHGLRGAAGAADARWVESLARELGVEIEVGRASVDQSARAARDNLEQAARRERYEFLARVARECCARAVLTGHTLDDQAETVLLALLRGSGADGLGGMRPVRSLDETDESVLLVRPLLGWARRAETEEYCRSRGVCVRMDEMNADERFARVRVRRKLLPLLQTFNARVVESLARTAELLRDDGDALDVQAAKLLDEASTRANANELKANVKSTLDMPAAPSSLRIEVLLRADLSVRRRALRQWIRRGRGSLRRVDLVHVQAIENLLKGERGGRVAELPGGCKIERRRGVLIFHPERG